MHTYSASGTATKVFDAVVVLVDGMTLVKGPVEVGQPLVVGASVDREDVEVKSTACGFDDAHSHEQMEGQTHAVQSIGKKAGLKQRNDVEPADQHSIFYPNLNKRSQLRLERQ